MSNSDNQEDKSLEKTNIPTQWAYPQFDDEISFVDIALVLIRRFKAILVSLILLTSAATGFVYTKVEQYEVNSIFMVGSLAGGGLIESLDEIKLKLEKHQIPEVKAEKKVQGIKNILELNFRVHTIDDSRLVLVSSVVSDKNLPYHKNIHQTVLEQVLSRHTKKLEKNLSGLTKRKAFIENSLAETQKTDVSDHLYETYHNLLKEEAAVSISKIITIGQPSLKPPATSKKKTLVFLITISITLSIILAFILEFFDKVKKALDNK